MQKVISLYTGAGGLDYGLEKAGFDVSIAIEIDKWCCETLRHNRNWLIIEDSIENISSDVILNQGKLKQGDADLLTGGPPCQPFSKSGYWVHGDTSRLKDPRANTLREYIRVLKDTLPKAFILENVFGLAYKKKDEGLLFLQDSIEQINRERGTRYSFEWKVINSADFGVPQIRERVFVVGSRDGIKFDFPVPQFYPDEKVAGSLFSLTNAQTYRTSWDAIGGLVCESESHIPSKVGGKWGELLPTIPPGENYLWHTERGGGQSLFKWRSRYWSFLLKLHPDKPSWTIQAQPGSAIGPFHWNNRRLTMREMARIQTFPDDVEILGGVSQVQKQLGNAVPPAIGELLGKEIRKQFFGDDIERSLSLIPSKNTNPPTYPYEKEIPAKYLRH